MSRTEVLQEVRLMRFEDVNGRYQSNRLSCEEAAELLGASVSTFSGCGADTRRKELRVF